MAWAEPDDGLGDEPPAQRLTAADTHDPRRAAPPREPHGRTVAQFEKPSDPPGPPPEAPFARPLEKTCPDRFFPPPIFHPTPNAEISGPDKRLGDR
jgi:hypothetical protein